MKCQKTKEPTAAGAAGSPILDLVAFLCHPLPQHSSSPVFHPHNEPQTQNSEKWKEIHANFYLITVLLPTEPHFVPSLLLWLPFDSFLHLTALPICAPAVQQKTHTAPEATHHLRPK